MIIKLINKQEALYELEKLRDGQCNYMNVKNMLDTLPTIYPKLNLTVSDYIMFLHKEYGCTLSEGAKAHEKALEYLREKAKMIG